MRVTDPAEYAPAGRALSLSEERRSPGSHRRSRLRAGVRLGRDGRAAEGRVSRHRSVLRAATRRSGPRRRPVRIEFCEADVLDAFDDWRRAVGVAASAAAGRRRRGRQRRKPALRAHIERVIARLANVRGAGRAEPAASAARAAIRELDARRPATRGAARRGPAIIARLARLDAELMTRRRLELDGRRRPALRERGRRRAGAFRRRMPADARARASRPPSSASCARRWPADSATNSRAASNQDSKSS